MKAVEHTYDYLNRWVGRSVDADGDGPLGFEDTYFVYDGAPAGVSLLDRAAVTAENVGQIVLHFQDDTQGEPQLAHRNLWGAAVDQILADEQVTDPEVEGNVLYALTDHLGTVRDLVARDPSTGQTSVASHRRYDAYGKRNAETAAVDFLFGFTGRALDEETGLQNNLNRWYEVGWWISEDPIGYESGDKNLYRYCGNEPRLFGDATGLDRYIVRDALGFHWYIVVEQWGVRANGVWYVAGYTALEYSAMGFTMRPADPSSAYGKKYSSIGGPEQPDYSVAVYRYHSDWRQDNALLAQWAQMSNYTFNFGYPLGYCLGINCISMSDYWATYGGQSGPARGPVLVGSPSPLPHVDVEPVFTIPEFSRLPPR